ncbi:hypothetical protein [Qipengyuania nanhaisediminis]|uniref:hypothetical protein n=1 Tax=Qipengyuania nanhaisediminis TaxID=604088 RepID=UPI0038B40E5D
MLIKLAALSALGYFGYRYYEKNHKGGHAAFAEGQASGSHTDVRDAGPKAMRDKPEGEWTKTDEEIDQTFPASDPPANY